MPDYNERIAKLNQARAKDRESKTSIKLKLPDIIIDKMVKAANDGQSWVWPFAYMIASFNDLTDWGFVGAIPILGNSLDTICVVVLTGFFWGTVGFIKWRVRTAVWLAGACEIILGFAIIPEYFPFWIVCVFYAERLVKQQAELADLGMRDFKKGRINRRAIAQFK